MLDNASDLKWYCLKNAHSILKTLPKPKCANCSHIVNSSAEEPVRLALLLGLIIAILDPKNVERNVSTMIKNMIGHG